jgi:hypothetical protein
MTCGLELNCRLALSAMAKVSLWSLGCRSALKEMRNTYGQASQQIWIELDTLPFICSQEH